MKVQSVINQAQSLMDSENYEQAYGVLKSVYEQYPQDKDLLEKLALSAKILELESDAQEYFEQLVNIDPSNTVALSELQDIYLHSNKYKYYISRAKNKVIQGNLLQAIPDYKKAIDNTINDLEIRDARMLLAKAYEFCNKKQQSIDELYKVLDLGVDVSVYYKLVELVSDEDKVAGVDVLSRAISEFPEEAGLKELMAALLIDTNQLTNALEYAQSDYTKAKIYLMQGDDDAAFSILQKIEDKKNVKYLLLIAEYYYNKKEIENCEKAVGEFAALDPQNPLAYQMRALVEEEKDNLAEAHYNWGKFYLIKSDNLMAINEFLQAHNIDSKSAKIIKEIIKINENSKDTASLVEFYEKLLSVEPDNVQALEKLGDFYFDMYEFKVALSYFERLDNQKQSDSSALLKLAKCHEKMKNNSAARECYQKYIDTAPVSTQTEAIKAKLETLSGDSCAQDEGLLEKLLGLFARK